MSHVVTLYEKGYFAGGIKLVYEAATQNRYKATYRAEMQNPEPAVLTHQPDLGELQPIRAYDLDRMVFFEFHVTGGSQDATSNDMARILRWVDGANQPGLRFHMLNDAVELRLRVQLEGATNYTDVDIKWGWVDPAGTLFSSASLLNKRIHGSVIALHLPPYSEGAAISLHNDLPNGDFLVESGTAGTAQEWAQWGTSTRTLDNDTYLVNGQSQKVEVNATGQDGITSTVQTIAGGTDLAAFCWVHIEDGGDPVTLVLMDQSNNEIDSAKTSDSGLQSIVDRNGNTWKRLEVSGTLDGGDTGARLTVYRDSPDENAATTFYADAAYLQAGTTTVPSGGWVSFCDLDNRADEDNSNLGRRNWLDIALIPGDAPALVRYKTNSDPSSGDSWYMTRFRDGHILAANNTHWIDSSSFSDPIGEDTNGSWTVNVADANYSGGSYHRFLASGGVGSGPIRYLPTGDTARRLFSGPKVLYAQVSSDDGTLAASVSFSINNAGGEGGAFAVTTPIKVGGSNLHIIPIGTLHLRLPDGDEIPDNTEPDSISIDIDVSGVPNGNDINIDGLWLFDISENEFHIWSSILSGTNAWFDGRFERIVESQLGIEEPNVLGSRQWRLEPGLVSNRAVFVWTTDRDTDEVTITSTNDVTVEVWPRTRQLLGTF